MEIILSRGEREEILETFGGSSLAHGWRGWPKENFSNI